MSNKSCLPYRTGCLRDWMVQKARKELNETEETRGPAIEELRKLITKTDKLDCWTNEDFLLRYLRPCKFNVERAFERLHSFFMLKKKRPDIFPEEVDIETMRSLYESGAIGCLPFRDEEGCAINIVKLGKWDPEVHSVSKAIALLACVHLWALEDKATQICGIRNIWDFKDTSFKHAKAISLKDMQLVSKALKGAFPVRFKSFHIVSESIIIQQILKILKLFLSEKMRERIVLHGNNMEELHRVIPKEILPAEYGGENIHYSSSEWAKEVIEPYFEKYVALNKTGYP